MGDANLLTLNTPFGVCQSLASQASVRVGLNLCAAIMRLEPLEAKVLFAICYHYAQTSEPLVASLSELAALVNTTKDKTRHAIKSLTASRDIRACSELNSHGILPRQDYAITLEINEPKAKTKAAPPAEPLEKAVNAKGEPKIIPFDMKAEDCKVRMTKEELDRLLRQFGDVQGCYLVDQLDDYLKANPAKRYASHYLTCLNWDRRARESGKVFVEAHPSLGTGYFPLRLVKGGSN